MGGLRGSGSTGLMRSTSYIFAACMLLLPCLSGCAPRQDPATLKNIQQKLEEFAQQREDDQQEIQEIDSRLFLLEDKVDTLKVKQESSGEPKRHPVIRIRPGKAAPSREPVEDNSVVEEGSGPVVQIPDTSGKSLVESRVVEYDGEAKKQGPRPVLRLYGSSSGTVSTRQPSSQGRAAPAPIETGLVGERLGIVPIPRGSASKMAAAALPAPAPAAAAPAPKPARDAVKLYQAGLRQYKAGNYTGAVASFEEFVVSHRRHQYTDNAYYWLGECAYDQREYRKALGHFRSVVQKYPRENKVPDAMLKIAFCQGNLGDKSAARETLGQLRKRYPETRAAQLAGAALKKLK